MSRTLLTTVAAAALTPLPALAEVPRVVVDIAPVHSLVAQVMEGVGTPELLIPALASPHAYSLRPSEAQSLQDAEVVFWIGEELSPWLEGALGSLAEDAAIVGLLDADGTRTLPFRQGASFDAHDHGDHDDHGHGDHADDDHHDHGEEDHADHDDHGDEGHAEHDDHHHGDEDHAEHDDHHHGEEDHAEHDEHDHGEEKHAEHDDHYHGDEDHAEHDDHYEGEEDHAGHEGHDHDGTDPHAWLSPANAATWLSLIANDLAARDPENAETYRANAATAQTELSQLVEEIKVDLAPVADVPFIVFHDAYQYLEADIGLAAAGAISLGDASDPSPARLTEIRDRLRADNIACVLAEPQFNPRLVATVAEGSDLSTGIIDPLGAEQTPGPDLYADLMRANAAALLACLGGEG